MCKQWADRPGLLFSGTTWDTNINEFFVTTLMPLFQTASMTGLLTPGAARYATTGHRRMPHADPTGYSMPASWADLQCLGCKMRCDVDCIENALKDMRHLRCNQNALAWSQYQTRPLRTTTQLSIYTKLAPATYTLIHNWVFKQSW